MLHDNLFKWLLPISPETPTTVSGSARAAAPVPPQAQNYVIFPCGLIRGALANLGVPCIVSADIPSLPVCVFTIKITKS